MITMMLYLFHQMFKHKMIFRTDMRIMSTLQWDKRGNTSVSHDALYIADIINNFIDLYVL